METHSTPRIFSLILDRPTCLDCLVQTSGMGATATHQALTVIADTLKIYQERERCRVCDELKPVLSIKAKAIEPAEPQASVAPALTSLAPHWRRRLA